MARVVPFALVFIIFLCFVIGCGKKGEPLPPEKLSFAQSTKIL
jgi:hypothetical protein